MLDLLTPTEADIDVMLKVTGVYFPPGSEFMLVGAWQRWVKGDLFPHQFQTIYKSLTFAFNYGGPIVREGRLLDEHHRVRAAEQLRGRFTRLNQAEQD